MACMNNLYISHCLGFNNGGAGTRSLRSKNESDLVLKFAVLHLHVNLFSFQAMNFTAMQCTYKSPCTNRSPIATAEVNLLRFRQVIHSYGSNDSIKVSLGTSNVATGAHNDFVHFAPFTKFDCNNDEDLHQLDSTIKWQHSTAK